MEHCEKTHTLFCGGSVHLMAPKDWKLRNVALGFWLRYRYRIYVKHAGTDAWSIDASPGQGDESFNQGITPCSCAPP